MQNRTIPCYHCGTTVLAEVVGTKYDWDEEMYFGIQYEMLSCPKCSRPSFGCVSVHMPMNDAIENGPFIILYPSGQEVSNEVPLAIRKWLEEANKCYMVAAFTSSAIMCRKTLEAICVHENATGHNLADKLKNLKDQSLIDGRLYQWADGLRLSGNEAAHEIDSDVSSDDAKDILDFTHAIVEYIYTLTLKYERFKTRKTTASSKLIL